MRRKGETGNRRSASRRRGRIQLDTDSDEQESEQRADIVRAAMKPSVAAAGKTSCFSRPGPTSSRFSLLRDNVRGAQGPVRKLCESEEQWTDSRYLLVLGSTHPTFPAYPGRGGGVDL